MESKNNYLKIIREFRKRHAIDAIEEHIALTMHLMNIHSIDNHTAFDQTSKGKDDEGIDGWFFDERKGELMVYQSKFSENKGLVINGLNDLERGKSWLENVLIEGKVDKVPSNPCLYNLYSFLSAKKDGIRKISFILVSLFDPNELEDRQEYDDFRRDLINSKLMEYMKSKEGKIDLRLEEYSLDSSSLPPSVKKYPVNILKDSLINLRRNVYLDLAYISLYDLVELYRQRGEMLFNKNVRLSVISTKEVKERLVHPLEETFDNICYGTLSPNIFPFYHVGVTISAKANEPNESNILSLEDPSVINGCQTISIADSYLRKLEKENKKELMDRFKEIKVIAKIVIGTSDEELREITNSNNRQNPIENWQLFSNDPIHIVIEQTLKDAGIFYERQKGKFDAMMKHTDVAKFYPYTNGTFIKVFDLGQIICLSRGKLQWVAKPSEIFLNKKNHDHVFDKNIPMYHRDIILFSNLFKAVKRALLKYLELPTHSNDNTQKIFSKPLVKAYMYYVALLYFYQAKEKFSSRRDYSTSLNKIASPILVSELESFYQRIISRTKEWYLKESRRLSIEVSSKKLDDFLSELCQQVGIDLEDGNIPFTDKSIAWSEYDD